MFPFAGGILRAEPPVIVSLQGTPGAPITRFHAEVDAPPNATGTYLLAGGNTPGQNIQGGKVHWAGNAEGELDIFTTISDWIVPYPFEGSYYVRATLESGDAPNFGTLDAWILLSSEGAGANASWTWEALGPTNTRQGTLKLEIATDLAGTNIIATGYYRATVSNEL